MSECPLEKLLERVYRNRSGLSSNKPFEESAAPKIVHLDLLLEGPNSETLEKEFTLWVVEKCDGDRARAAHLLGMSREGLDLRIAGHDAARELYHRGHRAASA